MATSTLGSRPAPLRLLKYLREPRAPHIQAELNVQSKSEMCTHEVLQFVRRDGHDVIVCRNPGCGMEWRNYLDMPGK